MRLALDLSTTRSGWCVGSRAPQEWGAIEPPKGLEVTERICYIVNEVLALVDAFKPDEIYFEELNYARNMKVARALLGLRGHFLACLLTNHGMTATPINRMTALKTLGVKRKDGKQGVINALVAQGFKVTGEDEADSMAIFLTVKGTK